MTDPLNLPSLRKVAEEAHVKPHTVPIEEGIQRFEAYIATFDPPTVAERMERLEGALRGLTRAASDMLTGISVHNGLNPDAPARRHDIEGPVVTALSHAAHKARAALSPELDGATHG